MYNKKLLFSIGAFLLLIGLVAFIFYLSQKQSTDKTNPFFKPTQKQQPAQPPSRLLNLTNWKLTLPITSPDDSTKPQEILQPELATYQIDPWFMVTPDEKGVVFRAPVNAPTTANSGYPRSELREMTSGGKQEFFWPSSKGTHTLFIEEAITAVPKNKPDVVAGQIHGDDDDLLVIRLEGEKLFLARGSANLATLDENYTLGKRFSIKLVAKSGEIMTYYNNSASPIHTLEKKVNQAYFKVGVYTQSNCKTEKLSSLCSADNYGEVIIYQAKVTHE
jgi:hypothetical protein